MEQVPLVDAEQVAFYEAHRDEFQSWPSKLTFLAPPQDERRPMINSLFQLYTQARIPNLPEFENKYAAALFCSVAKNLSDIVERVEFKVSKTSAMWIFHLCKDTPPTMNTVWRYSYSFFHGTETGSLWRVMSEKNIKPALSDVDAVGFYCRVAVSDNDWDIKHAVHRVMTSGKWVTPAIIGGTVEITSQHATMNSGGGSEAQDLCRLRGVVHMRRAKKWIVRSDLAQINCLIIPLMRKAPVSDIDARGNRSFGSNFNQLLAGRV